MNARDVMVRDVITIAPRDSVAQAAKLIAQNDVSALPVIDDHGRLVGIISEGDLVNREEIGTEIHHPWWIEAVTRERRSPRNSPSRTASGSRRSCPRT